MGLVELLGDAEEFLDVLDPGIGLFGMLCLERLDEARLLDDHLHDLGKLARIVPAGLDHVREASKGIAGLRGKQARLSRTGLAGAEEGYALICRIGLDLRDRGRADATPGRVHDAQGADIVVRIHDELQVGHHIADLGTIEEARAADDLVRDTGTQEHVFEDAGLGIRAVEHRHIIVGRALVVELLDLGADPASLVALVCRLEEADLLAVALVREEALRLSLRVVGDDRIGGIEDVAGRAVVLLELHDLRIRIVLLEGEDVPDVGTTPGIDRLVIVAHDHQVAVAAGKQVREGILDAVRILVLVDADLAEALLVLGEHLRVLAQELESLHEEVVEVHRIGTCQPAVELVIDPCCLLVQGRVAVRAELFWPLHRILRIRDAGTDGIQRILLRIDIELVHDGLHETLGIIVVVDGERPRVAQKLAVLPEHAHAHGMEGADPHATDAARHDGREALAHLIGSLVREGDGKDLPGTDPFVCNHVGDPHREDAGLARTGASKDEKRPLRAEDRLPLGRIQPIEIEPRRSRARVPVRSVLSIEGRLKEIVLSEWHVWLPWQIAVWLQDIQSSGSRRHEWPGEGTSAK